MLGGAAVAAVIGFAGWRAAVSGHTIGNFTGFVAALLIASRPLRALGSLNAALQEGLAGLVRVFAVVDERPTILDAPDAVALPPGRGHVAFDDVHFVYPDGRVGLAGLSFEATPGRTVALVGPSGGGKHDCSPRSIIAAMVRLISPASMGLPSAADRGAPPQASRPHARETIVLSTGRRGEQRPIELPSELA